MGVRSRSRVRVGRRGTESGKGFIHTTVCIRSSVRWTSEAGTETERRSEPVMTEAVIATRQLDQINQ